MFPLHKIIKREHRRTTTLQIFFDFFCCTLFFFFKKLKEKERKAWKRTGRNGSECVCFQDWKERMSSSGMHRPYSIDIRGLKPPSRRTWIGCRDKQRDPPSSSRDIGVLKGGMSELGRSLTIWRCWVECFSHWFPSKDACCPGVRPTPCWCENTSLPCGSSGSRGRGRSCLLVSSWKEAEERVQ